MPRTTRRDCIKVTAIKSNEAGEAAHATVESVLEVTFPIIALGGSAGSLEAYFEFFRTLPQGIDLACVVIQHLDRAHNSMLTELLAKKTPLKARSIEDGMAVETGHLYVLPPNTCVTLEGDTLRLTPRGDAPGPNHPVDIFFKSLAQERADQAFAIVCSGGDSDGSRGVESVKHSGGITFAQEPSTTRFPSMPQSAIDTGCVDYVLPMAEIAREVVRLVRHPYVFAKRGAAAVPDEATAEPAVANYESTLKRIFRRLKSAHGVDFSRYKRSTLQRRLERRIALRRASSLVEYVDLLEDDPSEAAALYQDFLIRVTHFFRDASAFQALHEQVLPALTNNRGRTDPIRIWIPGCATGEEVYSLAIVLTEHLREVRSTARIQIFGTDVSEIAIEKARSGWYLENIADEVSSERLAQYFEKEGGRYRITKAIRELCIFARHDVTRDPPFSRLDLVSCRNLMIYLDTFAQQHVLHLFHYALQPHGFLVLGPSESVGTASDLFESVDKVHRIFARKAGDARGFRDLGHRDIATRQTEGSPTESSAPPASPADAAKHAADRLLLARYAPASLVIDAEMNILQFRGETAGFLEHAPGAASLNLQRVVRPELLFEIVPAIQEARATGASTRRQGLHAGDMIDVAIEVIPLPSADPCFLILLEDAARAPHRARLPQSPAPGLSESDKDRRLAQLEREVASTREYLRATLEMQESIKEELQSAHEEVLSTNEEFQSTNEELETAKEELQSTNEELTTTNEELRHRNQDLTETNATLETTKAVSKRAQRFAEAVVETIREPLLVLDLDLKVIRSNQAFHAAFGSTPELTDGRPLQTLHGGQWNLPELMERLHGVIAREQGLTSWEVQVSVPAGTVPRTLSLSARKIPGDLEREHLILLSARDVTVRNADTAQLRDTDRRKDEFLAMLGHELRNPLTPVVHAVRLLREGKGKIPVEHLYELLDRQSHRLVRLVDDLLDVARISRGHIELKREVVSFGTIVDNAAKAMQSRIEEHRHELTITMPRRPVWISGDAVRLEQVIANLIENAVKYTPPGGQIQVKLSQRHHKAMLTVRDNGIGIEPEALTQIFGLFMQVDRSLARSGGGLGIGLTLVQRVIEIHGGQIEARSAGLGHGAEFVVQLPVVDRKSNSDGTGKPTNGASQGPVKRRILIVDDNADAADTMALLARHWGHEVVVAHDGPAALAIAETFEPGHALVDIGLPGMDGYELGRQLRENHPEMYLVALTGYGGEADRGAAYEAGFDAHMTKPADLEVLQELLADAASHSMN